MSREMVRVYDFVTKTVTTTAFDELPSHMIRARVQGIDGEVWVNPNQTKLPDLRNGPFQHPPFPPDVRDKIRELQKTFADVKPMTFEEWENGFRKDLTPEREIANWCFMAQVYKHFTKRHSLTLERKHKILQTIARVLTNGSKWVLMATLAQSHSPKWVEQVWQIVQYMEKHYPFQEGVKR